MRYITFGGWNYYPDGGWEDYQGSFETLSEACGALATQQYDWWHVVDLAPTNPKERRIVATHRDTTIVGI